MLDGLRVLLEGLRVVPAAPPGFTPSLPTYDPDEDEHEFGELAPDLEGIAGFGCILTYADCKGSISHRRVTCRKLSERGGVLYLQGFCHERQALRTFRVDRITELACGSTGEVFVPATLFFERFSVTHDGGAAVGFGLHVRLAADLRAGLNVLAFLARVDGKVVPEEREVLSRYCQSFGLRYADDAFDFDGVGGYAGNLAPDAETFYVSIERLTRPNAPTGLAALTRQAAGQLIDADGVQHEKEFYYGLKLQEALA
jgi:hypothetical protein